MRKLTFPNPITLLLGFIFLATLLSYVLPTGEYSRQQDATTGRDVVVPNTYHPVSANPVNIFQALVAIPKAMSNAASVIFFVFLVGGAFTVVDLTGALRGSVDWLSARLHRRSSWVIVLVSLFFAAGGMLENMEEEIIPLVPVVLLLTRRLGFDAMTAVAISLGASVVGAAFSPLNPFQVGIAQQLAQLPLLSGTSYRVAFLLIALLFWIGTTLRYATRIRTQPETDVSGESVSVSTRHGLVLLIVLVTFSFYVYGVLSLGWGFEEMAALFFAMGIVVGVIGGLGISGTVAAFSEGFRGMTNAALLIGFAGGIFVVLQKGKIIDTIVYYLFTPLAQLPVGLAAVGMMLVQGLIHVPVPSLSGQAVLTLPVLIPLSDLLGLSRQVTVLAYQYGAGLTEFITPTNGSMMAIIAAAGVRYDQWLRFLLPRVLLLAGLGIIAILLAIAIELK